LSHPTHNVSLSSLQELNEALQAEATKHAKKILKSQESFPDLNMDTFPKEN
jgi:hypothetical protein